MVPAGPDTKHVLLIGPDEALSAALEESLAPHHASLTKVRGRQEALDLLVYRNKRPGLIILDTDLPNGDGFSLLNEIKTGVDVRHIPVVAFTAGTDRAAVDQAWDLGANCVIRKPERAEDIHPILPRLTHFWLKSAVLPRTLWAFAFRG